MLQESTQPKTMTFDEFLKELVDLKATWAFEGGAIRCADGLCPILAVYRKKSRKMVSRWDNGKYDSRGRDIGLNLYDRQAIADAADNLLSPRSSAFRQSLIKALHLG